MTRLFFLLLTLLLTTMTLNAQWVQVTSPSIPTPPDTLVYRRLFSDGINLYATKGIDGIYLSTNNGSSWTNIGGSLFNPWLWATSPNAIYAVSQPSAVNNDTFLLQVSTNNGTTWNNHGAGTPFTTFSYSFAFIGDSAFAIVGDSNIYLTTNNGTTWVDFNANLPISLLFLKKLHIQNGYLYVATNDRFDSLKGGVYRRPLNASAGWLHCPQGIPPDLFPPPPNPKSIGTFKLIGDRDKIYCGFTFYKSFGERRELELKERDKLLKAPFAVQDYGDRYWGLSKFSTSNGSSFSLGGFVQAYPEIMIGDTLLGNGFSANGTFLGFMRCTKDDISLPNWTPVNEGLPPNYELSYFVVCNNYLFGCRYFSGEVWRRPMSELLSATPVAQIQPKQFELKQNYPNPFNPNTTIAYEIKNTSTVSLKVYDLLGKEVSTLVNERKPAGTYQASFNATNLSSGTYFYRLQAGDFTQTKRMTLLK